MSRDYLKRARQDRNLQQTEVAKKLGISNNYYCEIENGNRQKEMKASTLVELSTIFKIPISKMLEEEKKCKEKQQ